jgi:tRNA wybutosine-synthesizing protein 5
MKTICAASQVSQVSQVSAEEFDDLYFQRNIPVMHKGGVLETDYFKKWSVEYLGSKIDSQLVKVNHTEDGIYNHNKNTVSTVEVPFIEALEFFSAKKHRNKSYYLQQAPIGVLFPQLLADLEPPKWMRPTDIIGQVFLWIGGAGCLTPLHYDRIHNFLIQVVGRKELTLFPPSDTKYLYPSQKEGGTHISEIDLDNPDLNQFPLFSSAQPPINVLLEPGDMLFIPPGWWHQVRSLDMSVSVSYWWNRLDITEPNWIGDMPVTDIVNSLQMFLNMGLKINHKTGNGELLLIKAINANLANAVEALLILEADANSVSSTISPGTSAILMATERENKEIVQLLLKYGAN